MQQIEAAIQAAIEEVNAVLPSGMQLSKSPEEVIFGRGGKLDSLGLVNLVLAVEEKLADAGLRVSLTDERAMSQTRSPFRTVRTLALFVEQLMGGGTGDTD